ncbi:ATP-binding protein [Roseovarius pacificus]|uniref:ATP-binding protein n=1 Tax=Roseovarius pacificus TaxID=337701 RepID=UPI000A01EB03|nr:ATP-binding protein [Roseovarius pacificus]GGO61064.1 ATPase AAA [Roseovarius pacificus]
MKLDETDQDNRQGLNAEIKYGQGHAIGELLDLLKRGVAALERISPEPQRTDFFSSDIFLWRGDGYLEPIKQSNGLDLLLLHGIDRARDTLYDNTRIFADGLPANHALLWGARGCGKSSLVKAVHRKINENEPGSLALVELLSDDIESLPELYDLLRDTDRRYIIFCDDLAFDDGDKTYKALKSVLDGGVRGSPSNILLYVTSNRRHLLSRDMIENEKSTALHAGEATEEKVSLSDRFGLWLGIHSIDQSAYLEIVEKYADYFNLKIAREELRKEALDWVSQRGSRSGRVAWQFIRSFAGQHGTAIPE